MARSLTLRVVQSVGVGQRAYSMNNNVFDVFVMITFGIVGYLVRKFDYEGSPLALAFVLGPMLDLNLRV